MPKCLPRKLIWAASLIKLGGEPPFSNHTDLYNVIDSTSVSDVKWDNFTVHYKRGQQNNDAAGKAGVNDTAPWMYDTYDVWYRDPHQVIHNILATSEYKDEMDYVPYREYDATDDKRRWQDFMSGDWAWEEAVLVFLMST